MKELTPDERKILVDAIQDSATVVHKGRKDMNERIRELARRAGFDVERMEINHVNGNPSMAEQFAELLLQDVMSICEDLGDKGLDGHYCVDKIRKEFGV